MLSAHCDSWDGASGATENGTGRVQSLSGARLREERQAGELVHVGIPGEDPPSAARGLHLPGGQSKQVALGRAAAQEVERSLELAVLGHRPAESR